MGGRTRFGALREAANSNMSPNSSAAESPLALRESCRTLERQFAATSVVQLAHQDQSADNQLKSQNGDRGANKIQLVSHTFHLKPRGERRFHHRGLAAEAQAELSGALIAPS